MNKLTILICAVILSVATAAFAESTPASSPTASVSSAPQKYTCPMHPEVVQDKPGKCPKCGMTLVPKEENKKPEIKK